MITNDQVLAQQTEPIHKDVLAQTTKSWDGNPLPNYLRGKPEVSILRFRIEPGARLPCHKHQFINAGVSLRGELIVQTEDQKTLHLKAGDSIVETMNKWHCGVNESTELAELIVFYAGKPGKTLSTPGDRILRTSVDGVKQTWREGTDV